MAPNNTINFLNSPIGNYLGLLSSWEQHAFSTHIIRDKEGTHFVYVNRGESYSNEDDSKVVVFTVEDEEEVEAFAQFVQAFQAGSREAIARFIRDQKRNPHNPLQKSGQKVENCSVANSNVSWHFALAAMWIQKHPEKTLEEALEETRQFIKNYANRIG